MPIDLRTEIPGPKSKELLQRRQTHVARGPFHTTPVFAAKAHGAFLEDVDGNKLLDFSAGIGVVNVGHTHPHLVKAIQTQSQNLIHASFNVALYEPYIRLAEKLNGVTPGDFPKKTFLANSGAEAVENAIKIARAFTGREGIVCFEHAFHGRTYMAMSLTYKEKPYKVGFAPLMTEIYRAPYPYCYRWPTSSDPADVSKDCFKDFEEICKRMRSKPAAVIIEPVLGEGGFVPAPAAFLQNLQKYCSDNGIVFIVDEIQSGFGRTGTLFASQQLGIIPDLILTAKGLGGGMPISAVTGRAPIMDGPGEGGIGGTFGGNPVSCAAALSVFEIFDSEKILEKAMALGLSLREKLVGFYERYRVIGDVRGLGPMLAMEFVKNRETKEAYSEAAKGLVKFCYERGVIIMTSGSLGNVVRLLPPLNINLSDVDEGFKILEAGIKEIK